MAMAVAVGDDRQDRRPRLEKRADDRAADGDGGKARNDRQSSLFFLAHSSSVTSLTSVTASSRSIHLQMVFELAILLAFEIRATPTG